MDYLRSYVSSAAQAVLAKGNSVPGLAGYTLGERVGGYEGHSIWSLHEGTKREDNSPVSVFIFDSTPSGSSSGRDRRSLLPLARNALRKLRSLRHPDVLRFIDGHDSDSAVYIVTEPVTPLSLQIGTEGQSPGQGDEWKVWGLSRLVNALKFINSSGSSTHANLRVSSIFTSPSGEWRLGGFEILSTVKDATPVLYTQAGLLPDINRFTSPEVRKSGWDALKELDPSALDSYQLHLLIYVLFNGPLPASFISDSSPSLPTARGKIPANLHPASRRLGNPNPRARLKCEQFLELGNTPSGSSLGSGSADGSSVPGGFFKSNRLVRLAEGLDNFALASEGERVSLIRIIKDSSDEASSARLPNEFIRYKILPSLVKAFEFGPGGPTLLPLVLQLGNSLPDEEYKSAIVQPLVRLYATPDRAMRMALLEGLPSYAERLDNKTVSEKIWPHLVTGFTDVVPVIRESTVKSILLIAPKLTDRILNNDLLRYLAKTQTDAEAGIRTNTCILLGRLSKHLSLQTCRKVLVPAFARALRDPFVHARIAGLMSLMATVEYYEKEDLAQRVIPGMSICLVDKEKIVRDQAFKAIEMFIKRTEALTASMPDTVLSAEEQAAATTGGSGAGNASNAVAVNRGQPGLTESAGGAAVALAGWAFTSLSARLGSSDLQSPMSERRPSSAQSVGSAPGAAAQGGASRPATVQPAHTGPDASLAARSNSVPSLTFNNGNNGTGSARSSLSINGSGQGDWGGDLMDVQADEDDFDAFESGVSAPPVPAEPVVHPRFTVTKAKPKPARSSSAGGSGKMKLGGTSLNGSKLNKSQTAASILQDIEKEEGFGGAGDWAFDGEAETTATPDLNEDWGASVGDAPTLPTASSQSSLQSSSDPIAPQRPQTPPVRATATPPLPAASPTPSATQAASNAGKEKLAQMKEERRLRLEAARAKKAAAAAAAGK